MALDIRNRDMTKPLTFKQLWLSEMLKRIMLDPKLKNVPPDKIKRTLLAAYDKRRLSTGRLYNNTDQSNVAMTQEQFINEFLNKKVILSGYACFYKNQDENNSIISAALENLGEMRKINKKKMEAAEHGSDDYIYYRILQLTYKVLMNSIYGISNQGSPNLNYKFRDNVINCGKTLKHGWRIAALRP